MRLSLAVAALVVAGVAAPARADKKLDEAVAKAEAQLAKGKEDEAVKILQKAAAQAPKDPEPLLALAQVLARLGQAGRGGRFPRQGRRALGLREPGRAGTRAHRSVVDGPAHGSRGRGPGPRPAGRPGRGRRCRAWPRWPARRRASAMPAARETAEKAVKSGTSSAAAHVARGDALLAAHLGREAEAAYKRASEIEPRSAAALGGLARALAAQGKAAPALEAARAATQADPRSGEAQAALALAHLAQDPSDKASEAMAAVQQGVILEPRNPLVKFTLGRVFESRGQLAEAAKQLRAKPVASTPRGRRRRSPPPRFSCARATSRPPRRDSRRCPAKRSRRERRSSCSAASSCARRIGTGRRPRSTRPRPRCPASPRPRPRSAPPPTTWVS